MIFDPANRRIVLTSTSTTAAELWSRWADWVATADNAKYLPAFRQAGGDDLGGGRFIPAYIFLLNGWRVRPLEQDHLLTIDGNLFVDGGGAPVVATLGAFNVSVQYTVPVQAQALSVSGGGGLTPTQATQLEQILKLLRGNERYENNLYQKTDEDTGAVLLEKVVTGGNLPNPITLEKP